ncbi:MAG: tetratricopeptide repeat protein [Verrucomicrobia bacterium]|nr:tetratricopeptide repeat protein [Verrucomicrobiota bacterium]
MSRRSNWLADAGWCVWGLFYWNVRKSFYRLRGGRGRCPCQDLCDSGTAGRTHCEPSQALNQPIRFRHVCPLLVAGPGGNGAFCSVPASEVRPFWGRALGFYGIFLAVVYLALVMVAFTGIRATGVKSLTWLQVAWPGRWHEIAQERSGYFFKQALQACARRDYQGAYRSMASALQQDPHNYEARLLMGQYGEFAGEYETADRFFEDVLREFPQARTRTAITLHDTLLATGRFEPLARHCLSMALADETSRPTWVRSLLLALHLGRIGSAFVIGHQEQIAKLDPAARRLIVAEAAIEEQDVPVALGLLRVPFPGPVNAVNFVAQVQLLLRAGKVDAAASVWQAAAGQLQPFDRQLTRSWIDRSGGYQTLAEMEFAALAEGPMDAASLDKLVSTLVLHPDRPLFLRLHRRFVSSPELVDRVSVGELWLAAVVCGASTEQAYWAEISAEKFHQSYPPISAIDFTSLNGKRTNTVPFLVGIAPFARETIASLYWRVEPASTRPGP